MGKGLVVGLSTLAVLGTVAVVGFGIYASAYNTANVMEKNIIADQQVSKNILAQYGKKIQEAAQVPAMKLRIPPP